MVIIFCYIPISSDDSPGGVKKVRPASYPPKKKKYPGISLINVDVKPLNIPRIPSFLKISFVMWPGPL